ncbi:hypothetical protein BC629DRAFT_1568651 [Irpex lacteus]|nr:hypothetical protein BC629DRAFT_1568651 [Irpex lacteus]
MKHRSSSPHSVDELDLMSSTSSLTATSLTGDMIATLVDQHALDESKHSPTASSPKKWVFDGVLVPPSPRKEVAASPPRSKTYSQNTSQSAPAPSSPFIIHSAHLTPPSTRASTSREASIAHVPQTSLSEGFSNAHPTRKLRILPARSATSSTNLTHVLDEHLHTHVLSLHYRPSIAVDTPDLLQRQELLIRRQGELWHSSDKSAVTTKGKGKEPVALWKGYTSPRYMGKQPTAPARKVSDSNETSDVEIIDIMDDGPEDSTDVEAAKMDVLRRRRQIE